MGGLIQRALELKKRLTVDSTLWNDSSLDKVDPAERAEILGRIDTILASRRVKVRPDRFSLKPRKRGSLLPLLVNLGALVAIVGGSLLLYLTLNQQEDALVVETAAVGGAEGKLLEAIRRESEQRLAAKDQEILAAQQRLEDARKEQQRATEESAARVASREQELRTQFATELEAERRRLQAAGVAGADLERRLRAYEDQKRAEYDAALGRFRAEMQEQLAAREAAIAAVTSQYQATLASVQSERRALEADLARKQQEAEASARAREQELTASARAREQELTADRARIAADLARISAQQDQERLALDQILSFYDRVNRDLAAERYDQALESLTGLRRLLEQPQVAALPAVQRRRSVELFIADSLERLITERRAPRTDTSGLVAAAEAIGRAANLVERGNRRYADGDVPGARDLYESALREIPEVQGAYARLRDIEELARRTEAARAADLIGQGDRSFEGGEMQASIDRYREAMRLLGRNDPAVERVVGRIADAGFRLYDARRQAAEQAARQNLLARLARARAAAAAAPEQAPVDPAELSRLLEAKLLLREIVGSEAVRAQYPELYDTMLRYFDVLASESDREGRGRALADAVSLVASIGGAARDRGGPRPGRRRAPAAGAARRRPGRAAGVERRPVAALPTEARGPSGRPPRSACYGALRKRLYLSPVVPLGEVPPSSQK